jgi:hypothetical protein
MHSKEIEIKLEVHYLSDEGSKVHSKKIKIGLESTLSK